MAWNAGSIYATAKLNTSPFEKGLGKLTKVAGPVFKALAIGAAAVGTAFLYSSVQAEKFTKSFANVTTLLNKSEKELKSLERTILKLDSELGSATEITEGYYQAFSAGAETVEEATAITVQSAKLAKAARTDMASSVDIITSALNAYGKEAITAEEASDLFFKTVEKGKITGEKLAGVIGQSIPLFATMGIELKQLTAGLATMTKQGINAAEATTQMNALVNQFIKPSEAMTKALKDQGIASGSVLLETEGLTGAMEFLRKATQGNKEMLGELVPNIRGMKGAMAFMGQGAKILEESLDAMNNSLGSTDEAFKKQEKTVATFKNEFNRLAIEIGLAGRPVVENLIGFATDSVKAFRQSLENVQGLLNPTIKLTTATDNLGKFTDRYRKIVFLLDKEQKKQVQNQTKLRSLMIEEKVIGFQIAETFLKVAAAYEKNSNKAKKFADQQIFLNEQQKKANVFIDRTLSLQNKYGKAGSASLKLLGTEILKVTEKLKSNKDVSDELLRVYFAPTGQKFESGPLATLERQAKKLQRTTISTQERNKIAVQAMQTANDLFIKSLSKRAKAESEALGVSQDTLNLVAQSYIDGNERIIRSVKLLPKSSLLYKDLIDTIKSLKEETKELKLVPKVNKSAIKGVSNELLKTLDETLFEKVEKEFNSVFENLGDIGAFSFKADIDIDLDLAKQKQLVGIFKKLKDQLELTKEEAQKLGEQFGFTAKDIGKAVDEVYEADIGEAVTEGVTKAIGAIEKIASVIGTVFNGVMGLVDEVAAQNSAATDEIIADLNRRVEKQEELITSLNAERDAAKENVEAIIKLYKTLDEAGKDPKLDPRVQLANEIESATKRQEEALLEFAEFERELKLQQQEEANENDEVELDRQETFTEGEYEISLAHYERNTELSDTELSEEQARKQEELADEVAQSNALVANLEKQRKKELDLLKKEAIDAYNTEVAAAKAVHDAEVQKRSFEQEAARSKNRQEQDAFKAKKRSDIAGVWINHAAAVGGAWASVAPIPFPGNVIAGSILSTALLGMAIGMTAAISRRTFTPGPVPGGLPAFTAPKAPAFARGGTFTAPDEMKQQFAPAIVNEQGGEMQLLPDGTIVVPHDISRKIAEGVSSVNNQPPVIYKATFNNPVVDSEERLNQMAEMVEVKLGGMMRGEL